VGGPGADYFAFERASVAAGRLQRSSAERELPFADLGRLVAPEDGPIAVSIFSLPSDLVSPTEARAFLDGVLGAESERELVVLTDGELLSALAERSRSRLTLVDTAGRGYSPWPRDAMTFARTESGDLIALLRPNRQPGREHDSEMGLLFVAGVPDPIDRALGAPRWSVAPVPFHNGQILWTPGVTWVSGHTLERRALELLGLDRVPVLSFATSQGLDAYLGAIDRAAGELEVLYRQPVRFVHTVPRSGALKERQNGIWRFGGGAGFDLDSLLTLLPRSKGGVAALVGSLAEGDRLLRSMPAADFESLARWLDFRGGGAWLGSLARRHHAGPRAAALDEFLDDIAGSLAVDGLEVERLPLLLLPADVRPDGGVDDFLLGWNNAVLVHGEIWRAEAFATPVEAGDELARRSYAAAGYRLDLVPPLRGSVLHNGGYRCASNHVRRDPGARSSASQ
jgi:hypothetical protein